MATINVTFKRVTRVGGVNLDPEATANVDTEFAKELVHSGDAVYTSAPVQTPETRSDVNIPVAQVTDSGAVGRAVVKSADLDAALAALGLEFGAADSGGTGKRAIVIDNA